MSLSGGPRVQRSDQVCLITGCSTCSSSASLPPSVLPLFSFLPPLTVLSLSVCQLSCSSVRFVLHKCCLPPTPPGHLETVNFSLLRHFVSFVFSLPLSLRWQLLFSAIKVCDGCWCVPASFIKTRVCCSETQFPSTQFLIYIISRSFIG